MIDSDEEPLVRGTVIDAGHSSVLLPDTESQAVLGSFGAGFSRQHTQQGDHVLPRVAPIQSADDVETQMLDALERDLTGPVVFPLSDGAEVGVAHVGRLRQSRRQVLIPQSGTPRSVQDRSHSESASVENQVVSDDTERLHGEGSVVSEEEEPVPPTEPDPVVTVGGVNPAIRAALIWMDEVDLEVEFCRRAAVFKSIPHFLRGP